MELVRVFTCLEIGECNASSDLALDENRTVGNPGHFGAQTVLLLVLMITEDLEAYVY